MLANLFVVIVFKVIEVLGDKKCFVIKGNGLDVTSFCFEVSIERVSTL